MASQLDPNAAELSPSQKSPAQKAPAQKTPAKTSGVTPLNGAVGPTTKLFYRCVCGCEVPVEPTQAATCLKCLRTISPEAIQLAMAATVSVSDLHEARLLESPELIQASDPLSGKLLGHFRLEQRLGAGGMGAVYRSLDTSLQRYVAVKVLRGGYALDSCTASPERVTALLQEAVAQARLNHPHVVTIYYVGRHEDEPFLAMELVPGPTLGDRLKEGPLPYNEVVQTALNVADALQHAHQFGIVHGDIKPSNLLSTHGGQIKLSDFGLSRLGASSETLDKVAGTPAYLAPELLAGRPPTIQSDMYALGVTLYELTFGRLPFNVSGVTPREWLKSRESEHPEYPLPWPREVPYAWTTILNKLLARDPQDRFADHAELIAALRRLQPVSTTRAAVAPRSIAYAIDQAFLLACLIPFAGMMLLLESEGYFAYRWLEPIVAAASLIVPALHLTFVSRGWSTVGRYLFQLRVVDEHGLPLDRSARLTREFLRNMFAWVTPFAAYAGLYSPAVDRGIDGLLMAFMALDIALLFLRSDGRTLHDWLCRSSVVLDDRRD